MHANEESPKKRASRGALGSLLIAIFGSHAVQIAPEGLHLSVLGNQMADITEVSAIRKLCNVGNKHIGSTSCIGPQSHNYLIVVGGQVHRESQPRHEIWVLVGPVSSCPKHCALGPHRNEGIDRLFVIHDREALSLVDVH